MKNLKKIFASVCAIALIATNFTSIGFAISDNNSDIDIFDGIVNGEIIDFDAYEQAYPSCNDQCNSPDFPDLESVINSRNQYWAEQELSTEQSLSTSPAPSVSVAGTVRAFSEVLSGSSNYDKSSGDDTWSAEKLIGYVTYSNVNIAEVRAMYWDDFWTADNVRCTTHLKARFGEISEFESGINSGSKTGWSSPVTNPKMVVLAYSPIIPLSNSSATYMALITIS